VTSLPPGEPVDLRAGAGSGPLWGVAGEDLNATLLSWPAGHAVAEHVNEERDVLVVVVDGSARVVVDGTEHRLEAPAAVMIAKGARRSIVAGPDGVRYVSTHRVRPGLQIRRPG
jgi:quercetin dioxygenase-like cupin family protein